MTKKLELAFIPTPHIGHLSSTIELAKLLINRHQHLSITILIIKFPFPTQTASLIESLCTFSATERIRFITLPEEPLPQDIKKTLVLKALVENQKLHVRETLMKMKLSEFDTGPDSPTLAGFVVDMFCISMIDVANELGIPTYVFYTSNAGYLSLLFHLQELYDRHNKDMNELLNSATEFAVPGFVNPIPRRFISNPFFDDDASDWIHENTRRFREAKGILVNTFSELESNVMSWFSDSANWKSPPVYSVGPILNLNNNIYAAASGEITHQTADILSWLDEQPPSSVLFLCFGSLGRFNADQTKEIANALERSGVRFLWSLRQPPPIGKSEMPSENDDIRDSLPEGFLGRTAGAGRVIGWAPQVEILAHPATGGFVSHCGWNSTLESLWYGKPTATWPMYGEQQFNAFEMAVELGLAVEISLEYSMKDWAEQGLILKAEKIESGIRKLVDCDEKLRKLVKVKSEESRKTVMERGSSFSALNCFIDAVSMAANFP